jgi:hypothetical protein
MEEGIQQIYRYGEHKIVTYRLKYLNFQHELTSIQSDEKKKTFRGAKMMKNREKLIGAGYPLLDRALPTSVNHRKIIFNYLFPSFYLHSSQIDFEISFKCLYIDRLPDPQVLATYKN